MLPVTSAENKQGWSFTSLWITAALSVPLVAYQLHRSRRNVSKDAEKSSIPSLPLFLAAKQHDTANPGKIAVIDKTKDQSFTYRQLLADTALLKKQILDALRLDSADLEERRIAFLVPAGYDYVVCQWAVWAAGGICVPMCMSLEHSFLINSPD